MKKLCVFLACLVLVGVNLAQAQTVRITGTVKSSEDGMPIPGVSVIVKGTTTGAATNIDGMYEIKVADNAQILVFSFVGFKTQEIEIGGRSIIDVALESESIQVEELVVTALGISRSKKSLGYTTQDVKSEELTKGKNPDIVTALSGKVAGVEIRQSSGMPGAPSTVLIRGGRSFSGSNAPLYVVDGMPINSDNDYGSNVTGSAYTNRASDIDPNDIESINVLKGQAAAALYGLKASNGVILITTKKGKGNAIGTPTVSITSNVTIDKVSKLPDVQQTWAQGNYAGVVGTIDDLYFAPAQSYTWGPAITTLPDDPTYGGNNYAGHAGQFFDPYKGMWTTPQAYNNAKNFFSENGYTYNNSINVSNATAMGNYSLGFGSTNQTGIISSTGMDRYTAKMGGDFNLASKWKMGFSGNYSDQFVKKLPSGNDSWLFTVYGAPASFDLVGTPYQQEGTNGQYRQISYRRGAVGENPRWATANNYYHEKTKRFFGNSYLEFKPTTWATVKYQIGVDTYNTTNEDLKQMGSASGQALPSAAQYPTPNNPVYAYVTPAGGKLEQYGVTRRSVNSLFTVMFNHSITPDLNGSLLLGNEIADNKSEYYYMLGTGFVTPGWNNMNNTTTQTHTDNKYLDRTVGFFGNLSLDYKNMLFFNATGRYDVVSTMPTGNRGFFYPSFSLGFLFTELEPLKGNKILSYGKVRGSYAEVGQAGTFHPVTYALGGAGSGFLTDGIAYPFNGISGYQANTRLYDPNLKPQNTVGYEFGIELKFFNNKFGIDYSYFNQKASDQIFAVPMAGSTGYGDVVRNAGEMTSIGHEIVLNANPVSIKNFDWNISANFTKIVNKCVSLADGVTNISLGGFTTPNIRASAGDTYPAIYGESFERDEQGRILVDENPANWTYGFPLIGEFKKIGSVSPDFIISFTNSFTVLNNFSISAQVDWKNGGQMYSGSNRLMNLYGASAKTEDRTTPFIYPGYKADGTPNDIERGGPNDIQAYADLYNGQLASLSESSIYSTSFVKLREVSVGYNIPSKFIKPLLLKSASVNLVARNFLLWSEMPNFDPEASQGQGNMQGGMDYMSLPQTTSYGFSVNLTF